MVFTQDPYGPHVPPVVQQFEDEHVTLIFDRHPDLESLDSRALQTTACFAEPIRLLASYQDVPIRPPPLLHHIAQSLYTILRKTCSPIFWAA